VRLDKFLKASRLVKRRTVAKELCDAGRITVGGRTAKAGTEVKVGDILAIRYGNRVVEVRVLRLVENPRKDEAAAMYEVLSETPVPPTGSPDGSPDTLEPEE
jgi:ribosomal 50S subunit-recycling heat shock protein